MSADSLSASTPSRNRRKVETMAEQVVMGT